ncbi:hypothetical protein [Virgibacillus sp. SK37]|uniref:hypothetical protein n=1 Tax=Virgibacillus sp. SK37 TaxID=403957 RepID=UPI0004D11F2B|nr:hypothetical protein [Virgibacillus sp. SK37]AIF42162.1 hypothetical protein X953_01615 [Virgibacillus sp. SK37]
MKYINGLYASFVLMMIVILVNTTIFDDEYSGIFTYICLGIFIVGNAFFINAKRLKKSEEE